MNTSSAKVKAFLQKHPMGVLSTVSDDGKPWGSPIYFVIDDDLHFFFVTRLNTLKYKNIHRHSWAALTVADGENQVTIQVLGKVAQVPPNEAIHIILGKLERIKPKGDYEWVPPIMKVHKGDYMVLELIPTTLQYADFKKFKSDIHAEYIEKII